MTFVIFNYLDCLQGITGSAKGMFFFFIESNILTK